MLTPSEMQYLEQTLPFFSSLTASEQAKISQSATRHSLKKGQSLYHSSNECLGLIVLLRGVARSYLLSPEGKEVTLFRLWEGDICILSASCLLENITFELSMDVQEDTEFLLISSELYSKLMEENPAVQSFTYQLTNHRFSDVMWTIEQIVFMSLDQRIAIFLLDECSKNHTETVYLTHAEIASYIGSAREAVTRMLKYMQDEGLIELSRKEIRILNRKRLYELTQ